MNTFTKKTFTDLTWEDLNEWAGEKIVSRGKSYRRNVKDLCETSDGSLLATVRGTEFYSTRVGTNAQGELFSECTCPYSWGPCKHAVAVIVACLDAFKNKQTIPLAAPDDERIKELAGEFDDDFDNNEDLIDEDEDEEEVDQDKVYTQKNLPIKKDQAVRTHLETLSKKELVDIVMSEKNVVPGLRQKLADNEAFQKGDVSKLMASVRHEIKKISSEPAWSNHWNGEGNIPNYAPVKKRLKNLLANGHADAVLELGDYLMERGIGQIEQSNDEGETCMEIGSCMSVIFEALMRSKLAGHQRLLWAIDMHLRDGYGILDGIKNPTETGKADADDWSQVADVLMKRMEVMPKRQAGEKDDFSSRYHREKIMDWLLLALEKAHREKTIIGILENETAETDCYVDLVEKLTQSGQSEKAKEWACKGYTATLENSPGIASELEEFLHKQAIKEQNNPLAAAYSAFEFFAQPNLNKYAELKLAATKAGVWDSVRKCVMTYLETGERPDNKLALENREHAKNGKNNQMAKVNKQNAWPLPSLPISERKRDSEWSRSPNTTTLIDIAIDEKRCDDVLSWYRLANKNHVYGRDSTGDKVAQAICDKYPEEAIGIWKRLIAQETTHANQEGYQVAGNYLKKLQAVFKQINKIPEWNIYFASIREANKRRPRMIDVLNKLEGLRTKIVG